MKVFGSQPDLKNTVRLSGVEALVKPFKVFKVKKPSIKFILSEVEWTLDGNVIQDDKRYFNK